MVFYSHFIRRSDGRVQSCRMKKRTLGKEYRQLPRRRVWERRFGKRVRVYEKVPPENLRFCFVKGFMTRRGRRGGMHWVDTSVDVWLEFVISPKDVENIPTDREIVKMIEDEVDGLDAPVCYIRRMRQVKHEWGVEREATKDAVTWPFGKLTLYRMPGYGVMDKVERVRVG